MLTDANETERPKYSPRPCGPTTRRKKNYHIREALQLLTLNTE